MPSYFFLAALLVGIIGATGNTAYALEINEARAKSNYQIFCQGCHQPNGEGRKGVPAMKGEVGHFLKTEEGRQFLVRVPGSANATVDNTQLAEVLNWILINFSGDSLPEKWQPYSANEVGKLRIDPLKEVTRYRDQVLKNIATQASY